MDSVKVLHDADEGYSSPTLISLSFLLHQLHLSQLTDWHWTEEVELKYSLILVGSLEILVPMIQSHDSDSLLMLKSLPTMRQVDLEEWVWILI